MGSEALLEILDGLSTSSAAANPIQTDAPSPRGEPSDHSDYAGGTPAERGAGGNASSSIRPAEPRTLEETIIEAGRAGVTLSIVLGGEDGTEEKIRMAGTDDAKNLVKDDVRRHKAALIDVLKKRNRRPLRAWPEWSTTDQRIADRLMAEYEAEHPCCDAAALVVLKTPFGRPYKVLPAREVFGE